MKKIIYFIIATSLFFNFFNTKDVQSQLIQAEMSSRLVKTLNVTESNQYVKVLVLLEDRVDIESLDKMLYE